MTDFNDFRETVINKVDQEPADIFLEEQLNNNNSNWTNSLLHHALIASLWT